MWLAISRTAAKKTFLHACPSEEREGKGQKIDMIQQNCADLELKWQKNDGKKSLEW